MIKIGDIVRPNKKAIQRNSEIFTNKSKFIVTEIQDDDTFDLKAPKYLILAAPGDTRANYGLPITEVVVEKKLIW